MPDANKCNSARRYIVRGVAAGLLAGAAQVATAAGGITSRTAAWGAPCSGRTSVRTAA